MKTGHEKNQESLNWLFNSETNHQDYIMKQLNDAEKHLDKLEDLYDTAEYFAKEDDLIGVNHASRDMKEDTYTLRRKTLQTKSMMNSRRPIKSAYHEKDSIADIYTTLTGYNVEKVDIGWYIPELDKHFYSIADMRNWMKENKKSVSSSRKAIKSNVDRNTLNNIYNDLVSILKFDGVNMNGSTEDYQREWMFWGEHLRFASDGNIWYIITPYIHSCLNINYEGKTYDDFLRIKNELIDKLGGGEKAPKRVWKTDSYGHEWTRDSMFNA